MAAREPAIMIAHAARRPAVTTFSFGSERPEEPDEADLGEGALGEQQPRDRKSDDQPPCGHEPDVVGRSGRSAPAERFPRCGRL